MKSKIELFLCSAPEDELFRKDLEKHLRIFQRYGLIDALWSSQNIVPGVEVDQEIDRYLNISQLILLLVSPSFLSSDDCYKIILRAMNRHEREIAQVIPIILRPVDWKDAPFGKLKVLPTNENPLTSWPDLDAALHDVAVGIRQVIEQWMEKATSNLPKNIENPSRSIVALDASKEFSFALVRTLMDHLGPVASVAFSSDGQFLISDSWDNTIKIWNKDAGSALYTWKGHEGAVYSVGFSSDMHTIASGGDDCTVKLWEASSKHLLTVLSHNGPVSSVALSADSKILVSGSDDCTVKLWEIPDGRLLMTFIHGEPVSSVALSADSKILVSGGYDTTIKVWEVQSGREIQALRGHTGPVSSVALSADSKILVSGSYDKTIKVWDMPSGQERLTLIGHSGPVSGVALSPDATVLVSGSYDKTVKVWNIVTKQLLKELTGHAEAVLSVALHPDGNIIASGSLDKTIKIWQKPPTKTKQKLVPLLPTSLSESLIPGRFFVKRVCPACSHEFYPGDCDIVSSIPEQHLIECAPQKKLKRFVARIWPKSLANSHYALTQAHRQCPSCDYLLPVNIERVRNINIVLVSASSDEESHYTYLAALVRQIQGEWAGQVTGPIQLTCLTPEVESIFHAHYLNQLPANGQSNLFTANIPIGPLIYQITTRGSIYSSSKTFNLVLHFDIQSKDKDIKSIDFESGFALNNRRFMHANSILFLVDPMGLSGIRDRLPHNLQQSARIVQREPSDILSSLVSSININKRIPPSKRLSDPIALVLSKSDLLRFSQSGSDRIHHSPSYSWEPYTDLADLSEVDQEVRSLLNNCGEGNFINLVNHHFSSAQFFATGGYPLDQTSRYSGAIEPIRCLDPLLWILYRLHVIGVPTY